MNFEDDGPPLLVDTSDIGISEVANQNEPPVPVTIVSGYLGSGKSTLLKHLTTTNSGLRIAVILNELGQTSDIERSLSVRRVDEHGEEVQQWVELDNGCMCCTAKDAGVTAIEQLMKRQGRFDHIIVETSGAADPAPIAAMFWLDQALMASVRLDGIVTVVDARTITRSLADGDLASVQIACADVVLVNKSDTVDGAELRRVMDEIQQINGAASLVKSTYGEVSLDQVLGLDAYSPSVAFDDAHPTLEGQYNHDESSHSYDHYNDHDHEQCDCDPAAHDSSRVVHTGLSTVVVPLDPRTLITNEQYVEFDRRLHTLLWSKQLGDRAVEIHRAKGRLQCGMGTSTPITRILQGVREVYEITEVPYEPASESKLVLIGRGVEASRDALIELFA